MKAMAWALGPQADKSNEMLCLGSALGPGRALGCRDFGRALGPQADKALRCCTSVGR